MKKNLSLGVDDADQQFIAALPAELARFHTNRLGADVYFSFDEPDFESLRKIRRLAVRQGRATTWTSQFLPEQELQDARIYQFYSTVGCPGARLSWNGFLEKRNCTECGKEYHEVDESRRPELDLSQVSDPLEPVFTLGEGVIITGSFLNDLRAFDILHGLKAIDLHASKPCFLLWSSVDLGLETWDDSAARCGTCGRLLVSPGFFPLFEKPAGRGDIYFSRQFSSITPIVGGALGRALRGPDEREANPWFCGWYPDDLELARLPSVD